MKKVNGKKRAVRGIKKIKKDIKNLKIMNVPNYKNIYIANNIASSNILGSSALIYVLNAVAPGSTEITRMGVICRMKSIEFKCQLYTQNTTNYNAIQVRCMLVKEKTCLGSAPALAQIFNSSTPVVYDVRNYTTRDPKRFVILYDKTMTVGARQTNNTSTFVEYNNNQSGADIHIHIKKKLNFITTYQRADAGTVGDIEQNSLSWIVITDNSTANNLGCALSSNIIFDDA